MFQELILLNHGRFFEGFLCIFLKGFNPIVWLLLSCKDRAFPTKRAIEPQWHLSCTVRSRSTYNIHKEVKLTLFVWIYAKMVKETQNWLVKVNEDLRKRNLLHSLHLWLIWLKILKRIQNNHPTYVVQKHTRNSPKHLLYVLMYVNAL